MKTEVKTMFKYCNICKTGFGKGVVHYLSLSCPVSNCKNKLIKINDDMYFIIATLNRNNYPVIDASLENNSVYIILDRKCRFPSLPKGFTMNGINNGGEYAILISYSELNLNKNDEELKVIAEDLSKWVKTFCK